MDSVAESESESESDPDPDPESAPDPDPGIRDSLELIDRVLAMLYRLTR